ncbi:hypothetical protein BH18ACT4_BH18ACT4_11810 [soil metagenome]
MNLVARAGLVALAAVGPPGCGDDDEGRSGDGAAAAADADVTVVAGDSLDFDRDSYATSAGEIAIAYRNGGASFHTLVVEDREDDLLLEVTGRDDVDSGTIALDAGEYVVYCDVPGHRNGGMEATFTVE